MEKKEDDKKEFKTVHDVLFYLQKNIIAPKTQHNEFGNYYYRDAEDILQAAKKVMPENAGILLTDETHFVECPTEFETVEKENKSSRQKSNGRVYIKATASLLYNGESINSVGFAREELQKKGMDGSQVTASSSSYARKIALNGLLMINDSDDADATDATTQQEKEDNALMEKTGQTNIQDARTVKALGNPMKDGLSKDDIEKMYLKGLSDVNQAETIESLEAIFKRLRVDKHFFNKKQQADLVDARDRAIEDFNKKEGV